MWRSRPVAATCSCHKYTRNIFYCKCVSPTPTDFYLGFPVPRPLEVSTRWLNMKTFTSRRFRYSLPGSRSITYIPNVNTQPMKNGHHLVGVGARKKVHTLCTSSIS
ncbi:unnamed protein product [Ectocarpus fasciculatus]